MLMTMPDGRVMALRKPGDFMMEMEVVEAAGLDARGLPTNRVLENNGWMFNAQLVCLVASIDSVPEPFPANLPDIKALMAKLGRPVINEIMKYWMAGVAEVNNTIAKK